MAQRRTLTAADGHRLACWRSEPDAAARGGVVILHAVFGLTTHMGDVCDSFAEAGYAAIAPALYDRVVRDRVYPYSRDGVVAGQESYGALSRDEIFADIGAAASALPRPIAISGFCTGGTWAWIAAAELDFDGAVIFYGSHIPAHLDLAPRCPTLLHYGDDDAIVPPADIARIGAGHPEIAIRIYPGGRHAFFNPEQDSYDPNSAAAAWHSSVEFLENQFAG